MSDAERLAGLHHSIASGEPISIEWLYSAVRHYERNCDWDEPEDGAVPDRQSGEAMGELINALPALLARIAALEDALRTATKTANLLYANAVGCATNHYGEDIHQHGLPGWLADCAKDIEDTTKALGKGSE